MGDKKQWQLSIASEHPHPHAKNMQKIIYGPSKKHRNKKQKEGKRVPFSLTRKITRMRTQIRLK